jgi:hypothetical protein
VKLFSKFGQLKLQFSPPVKLLHPLPFFSQKKKEPWGEPMAFRMVDRSEGSQDIPKAMGKPTFLASGFLPIFLPS